MTIFFSAVRLALCLARRLASGALLVWAVAPGAMAAAPFEDSIAQRTLACTACHGPQGRAAPDGYYPRLAGKPAAYLYNQLLNFRDGRRHYGLMAQLVAPLSDSYLMEISQYFSALDVPYPAPAPATTPAEVLRQGRQLVLQGDSARGVPACVSCHGAAMTGVAPAIPGLLGLPRDYLNAQLGAWKTGQRRAQSPDCMKQVVDRLNLDELNAAASWLAVQPLPASSKPVASLPKLAPGAISLSCAGTALKARS